MRKTFSIISLGIILLFAGAVSSCQKNPPSSTAPRLVVLSPEVAEIIAALGAEDQIVGLTQECDYPPQLAEIKKVGNFGLVDREAVIALKPDMIFTSSLEHDAMAQEFSKLGYTVHQIYPRSVRDISHAVNYIGEKIGRTEEANSLASELEGKIEELRRRSEGMPRPRVYMEIYRDPLMSVSDASYVGDLIETAGGNNVFDVLERDYCRIDAEDVVAAKPDIIICYSQESLQTILNRKGWQDIPAIRNKRVYFEKDINPDWLQRATPRAILGMERLRELLDTF